MPLEKPFVVLDKSFLIGVGASKLNALLENYQFIATEYLIGECLQAFLPSQDKTPKQLETNVKSLLKFSGSGGTLIRIQETGPLISTEVRTRHPCWPIEDYLKYPIQFGPDYFRRLSKRRLQEEDAALVERWSKVVDQGVDIAIEIYTKRGWLVLFESDEDMASISDGFSSPESKRMLRKKLPNLRTRIGTDIEFVREQYRRWARPFQYPPHHKLTRQWLLFRLVQIQLLFQLNLLEKNGMGPITMLRRTLTHEWLDYQYCVLAAQCGAIATGEKSQMERFLTLRPDGLTLFHDKASGMVLERSFDRDK